MAGAGDIAEIKALLQARIDDLCRTLAPEGHRSGGYWICRSAEHDTKTGGMFIWLTGGAIGAWKDAVTGAKGDVIGLIQYRCGLDSVGDALKWARQWLNFEDVPPARRREIAADQAQRAAQAAQREADEIHKLRKRAFAHWLNCNSDLSGTPAAAYLAGRGIDLAALPRPASALRFSAAEKHAESGRTWPAMVALIEAPGGEKLAIHRTFLAPDGAGKAPVAPQRKIWPRGWAGGVIKIARGATGVSATQAAARGLVDNLILCEGVEDGLSLALACPDYRVWAVGTLGNLAAVALPECCAEVTVLADNDWGKREAEAAFDRAIKALAAQGRPVRVARSHVGKDANDALIGKG